MSTRTCDNISISFTFFLIFNLMPLISSIIESNSLNVTDLHDFYIAIALRALQPTIYFAMSCFSCYT